MERRQRPYLFYGAAQALCGVCLRTVEAKEVIQDGCVYLLKRCPQHGAQQVLLADDAVYYRRAREVFLKEPEQVERYNTPFEYGCPLDCGICPEHEQHGCLSLLEITDHCNLRCPTCYASSGPERQTHRSMEQLTRMLDRIVANEREPDVVQLSGGEPTLHPEFFRILDEVRARPVQHTMVNTNGIRIARDEAFVDRLASYSPGVEVYLQWDSLNDTALRTLRGAELLDLHYQALERLNARNVSTTLVMTVRRGTNDNELGAMLEFAAGQRCVRGLTVQPVQDAGRNDGFDAAAHRLTLTEVRRKMLEQSSLFAPEDIVPVPCHAECIAMAYGIKRDVAALGGKLIEPLTHLIPPEVLVSAGKNTIAYEKEVQVRAALFDAFSTKHGPESAAASLRDLLCCLPDIKVRSAVSYGQVFRLIILQFLDRHSLDLRSVRKSCVHIAHPDGKRIMPFDTYNIFYRDELERTVLEPLRRAAQPARSFSLPML
jgi:7,8-dihydro-6-hydroxymethylpterin dimethyltransferase